MKTIRHPNIVGFHDIIMEKGRIYLIEEYCEEGDLGFHIRRQIKKKRSYFSEKVIAKWLLQLLLALEYLHSKKIMHRDIRPENIFLTSLGNLKLGSFRSSKMFSSECELSATLIGSPYYMAPQCIESRGYDQKVDIWAFGCIMYQVCSLKSVFSDKGIVEQADLVLKGSNRELPAIYSKELMEIYGKCLTKNAVDRPSARSLIRQPYFLNQMKRFVTEKPEPVLRIPIKQYNVHFNILANKRSQKDVNQLKQTLKLKKIVKEQPKIMTSNLPKIDQSGKNEERKRRSSRSFEKAKPKEQEPRPIHIMKQKSIQKVREAMRQKSRQLIRQNSKQRQKSKQLVRKKSSSKLEKYVVNSPNQAHKAKDPQNNERKISVEKRKIQKTKTQDNTESPNPKSMLLPPPMLPRPPQKKVQRKETQKTMPDSGKSEPMTFSETKRKQELAYELSQMKNHGDFNKDEIKSSLTKIFDELNIKQEDQQQFSFEIEDENLARLTTKRNEGNQLLQTYKSKLEQLVEDINYKYCPLLEPIQQRTTQFDSNTFASFRRE